MLGILAPNKLFLNSISVFTVYTELETLPSKYTDFPDYCFITLILIIPSTSRAFSRAYSVTLASISISVQA